MICSKCGKVINELSINKFGREGDDYFYDIPISGEDTETGACWFDTTPDWTGYGLSEEEQKDTIRCPHCGKFPFESDEIQTYEFVRIVCFD